MTGPDPAVAAVRAAVRADLTALLAATAGLPAGTAGLLASTARIPAGTASGGSAVPGRGEPLVLVACSGGADSLALAAGTAWVAPRLGLRAGAVVVDHGWTPDSPAVAAAAAAACRDLGLGPVLVVAVHPDGAGGPEAAARTARYAALSESAAAEGAVAVLVGHTRDDQAETVLLGLARGSGTRSLAGMAPVRGLLRRPLLGIRRELTHACCAALGLVPARDPAGTDPAYARSRVRHRVLPVLEAELGPGVTAALARTARAARDDADALDALAVRSAPALTGPDGSLDCAGLARQPAALRRRVLRQAVLAAGAPGTDLTAAHVDAVEALVLDWHGQDGTDLPGGLRAERRHGRLGVARTAAAPRLQR